MLILSVHGRKTISPQRPTLRVRRLNHRPPKLSKHSFSAIRTSINRFMKICRATCISWCVCSFARLCVWLTCAPLQWNSISNIFLGVYTCNFLSYLVFVYQCSISCLSIMKIVLNPWNSTDNGYWFWKHMFFVERDHITAGTNIIQRILIF